MPNSTINATTNGLNSTAGNVATLDLQVAGSTVVSATSGGVAVTGTLSASGATTLSGAVSASSLSVNSNNISADNSLGFRNRIINGDMRIDQRNAGAAVTITAGTTYTVDRFCAEGANADGVFTIQQSSTAPVGFVNSIIATVTTADASLGATQSYYVEQRIEGTNLSDLAWGTANAKTVTLSFWVRSSLTGTFGGSIGNTSSNRWYPFSYTINSADTWEQKSVTISGDTTGTWGTSNTSYMRVLLSLGAGSSRSGTAGAWTSSVHISATGSVSVIGTLNATWYITGVQLEVGSVATPFERRPYGTELMLCQRYYQKVTTGVSDKSMGIGFYYTSTIAIAQIPFQTYMRAAPTLDVNSGTNYFILYTNNVGDTMNSVTLNDASQYTAAVTNNSEVSGTAGMAGQFKTNNASASLAFTAEL